MAAYHSMSNRYCGSFAASVRMRCARLLSEMSLSLWGRPIPPSQELGAAPRTLSARCETFDNQQRKDVKAKQHWCPLKQDHPKGHRHYGEPKRARNWKRRIQPRRYLQAPMVPRLLGRRIGHRLHAISYPLCSASYERDNAGFIPSLHHSVGSGMTRS